MIRLLYVIFAVLFVCPIAAADSGKTLTLDTCIAYFTDGEYRKAADSIKAILPLISDRLDEAEAYKYLGFSFVMLDLINNAKEYFKVALEKFPQMEIDTLEVPPNIAIVFRQTQIEVQMENGEILDKRHQKHRESRTITATVLSAAGLLSGATGGYYIYKGYDSYRDYQAYRPPDNKPPDSILVKKYWDASQKNFLYGGIATGVACISGAASLYFFIKKVPPSKQSFSVIISGDRIGITLKF